jgi:hypothetical protein
MENMSLKMHILGAQSRIRGGPCSKPGLALMATLNHEAEAGQQGADISAEMDRPLAVVFVNSVLLS